VTRAEALRALIERVEAGDFIPHGLGRSILDTHNIGLAFRGSLDAVARLEAPLRERGWRFILSHRGQEDDYRWKVNLYAVSGAKTRGVPDLVEAQAEAPTEPRARLLAVLRALAWEAEQPTPQPEEAR
jgi:hypothetical protein